MKLKPVLLYLLFFTAAFLAFTFLLFPQKQVAEYLSRSLTIPNSNIHVSIDNVKLAFPMNFKFENTKLLLGQDTQIAIKSTKLFLNPVLIFKKDKKNLGNGRISINDFSADMKNSIFHELNLPLIDFSEIELEFTQKQNIVTILKCTAKGSIINVKLKGNIDFTSPVQKSRLNLTGVVLQDSPYLSKFKNLSGMRSKDDNISKTGIRFNIKGVLGNPEIGI